MEISHKAPAFHRFFMQFKRVSETKFIENKTLLSVMNVLVTDVWITLGT